jgi:hypothetical protein
MDVYPMMKGEKKKVDKPMTTARKLRENECQYYKKSNHKEKKCFWNPNKLENKLKENNR